MIYHRNTSNQTRAHYITLIDVFKMKFVFKHLPAPFMRDIGPSFFKIWMVQSIDPLYLTASPDVIIILLLIVSIGYDTNPALIVTPRVKIKHFWYHSIQFKTILLHRQLNSAYHLKHCQSQAHSITPGAKLQCMAIWVINRSWEL